MASTSDNKDVPATEHDKIPSDKGGNFKRPDSTFRNVVSADPSSSFPAEKGRYLLYVNYGCPWAHRAIITRKLKGLEDIVELVEVDEMELGKGWVFSGKVGPDKDPRYGFKYLRQLYEKADPEFKGRVTVPVLWDTKAETIVNNESSEIIRIFYDAFDQLLPEDKREATKGKAGIFPEHLHAEIEAMNEWVYDTVNNGVYKCGFAASQEAYDTAVHALFKSLDRIEEHLADEAHQPYLFGKHLTEADIRLYTTTARFDVAYYPIFQCNIKMIRHDYPKLNEWLKRLYWDPEKQFTGAFKSTTRFEEYKIGYGKAKKMRPAIDIISAGPKPDIMPL